MTHGAGTKTQDEPSASGGLGSNISLQLRLLGTLLALLTLALAVSGAAAGSLLRDYLEDRVDRELTVTADRLSAPRGPRRTGPPPLLPSRSVVAALDGDGKVTQRSVGALAGEPPDLSFADAASAREAAGTPFTREAADGTPWRVLLAPLSGDRSLVVATSLDEVAATTQRLSRVVLLVGSAVLLLGTVAGFALVRASLRPLRRIEGAAGDIARGDLSHRVPQDMGPRTEVGRLSRSLNLMLSQIEEAFAAKDASEQRMRRFVADAGHELRTPLTSIRGFAELYRQGAAEDPAEAAHLMRRIEEESTRMAELVEDLLLLARLDRQRPLRREPVDLVVVAADVVHDAGVTAAGHHLSLDAPEAGLEVLGDEARLRQVLLNLVVNAVRHTSVGTHVHVRVHSSGPWGVVEVVDDGPGIPLAAQSALFDGFARADASRSRARGGGAGLGLAIVAALVRSHGGEVEVESTPGQGATFRVRLPLARSS